MRDFSAHVSEQMVTRLVGRVVSTSSSLRDIRHAMTGEVLCQVPDACPADVERAVAETRRVQEDWAQKPVSERVRVFLRFHDLVLARQQEILDLIQLENGKARTHAFEEVLDVAMTCRYYAQVAGRLLAPARVAGEFPVLTQTRVMRRFWMRRDCRRVYCKPCQVRVQCWGGCAGRRERLCDVYRFYRYG